MYPPKGNMGVKVGVEPCDNEEELTWKQEVAGDAGSLTVHGFPRIITARTKWGRAFWTIAVIALLASIMYTFFASYVKFGKKQVYISKSNIISDHIKFPSITLCTYVPPLMDSSASGTRKGGFADRMLLNESSTSCIFSSVYSCNFTKDFRAVKGFPYCITFNPDGRFKQTVVGGQFGLQIVLFVADGFSSTLLSSGCGIQVIIHDPEEYPLIPLGRGLYIMAGYETHIVIKAGKKVRKESPYPSHCLNSAPDQQSLFPGKYTTNKCAIDCYYRKLYSSCGDLPEIIRMLLGSDVLPTRGNATTQCYRNATESFVTDSGQCECPLPCTESLYATTTSATKWNLPPASARSMLEPKLGNLTMDPVVLSVKHLAKVVIYFNTFEEEIESEEELYDRMGLLSDIGGQLGLLLGASVISLLELIWFIIHSIIIWCHSRKNKQVS